MPKISLADRLVFAAMNTLVYLRYPRFAFRYRRKQGRWPNFATPRRMTELVQWRKLFDRNPTFVVFADKLAVKDWVRERFPDLKVPETLWVGQRPEDIPDELIRPGVVIKTNNGSTQNYFPHREKLDRQGINRLFRSWMPNALIRWYKRGLKREWAYWPIKPKVFVETFVGRKDSPIVDIGVRAFDGELSVVSVATDYKTERSRWGYYDTDGISLSTVRATGHGDELPPDFQLPPTFGCAIELAREISRGFDYLRVDFLTGGEQVYLGEITLYPASGYGTEDWRSAATYRQWLRALHVSWFLATPQPWPLSIYAAALGRWVAAHRDAPPRIAEPAPATGATGAPQATR